MLRVFIFLTLRLLVFSNPLHDNASKVRHSQFQLQNCDDTINGIGIDWSGNDTAINEQFYTCSNSNAANTNIEPLTREMCRTPLPGFHVCLDKPIEYNETVPTGGPHRPVWVTYGEYLFMPPQRWVHAMEHGAAVFLYDPCADVAQIEHFKSLARSCLRRHIITPFKNLPNGEYFNIVTYGCRLQLSLVKGQEKEIVGFLRRHAIKDGPEFHFSEDGSYNFGLLEKARLVTDLKDSKICPHL